MADDVAAQATLSVNVQGEAGLQQLASALRNIKREAGAPRAATAVSHATQAQAQTAAQQIAYKVGYAIGTTLRAPFDALKATAAVAGRSLVSMTGNLGTIATEAGLASAGITAVAIGLTGLGLPIINLIAGFKLLQVSFGFAQQWAEDQVKTAGRTRRFFPQLLGQALTDAEDEMQLRMGISGALFGNAADQMQQTAERKFNDIRLARGLRGDKDIFARWGITPESLQRYERLTGSRVDLSTWLGLIVLQRERLEQQLSQTQDPVQRALLTRKLQQLSTDVTQIFDGKFADMVNAMSSSDLAKLSTDLKRAIPLGSVEDATGKAKNFTIALETLKTTFSNIAAGIGGDVAPSITKFMDDLNTKLLDVKEGGEGLGRALRDLASAMAIKTWEALRSVMDELKLDRVNDWIKIVNSWRPADTADTIKGITRALISFGRSISDLYQATQRFWDSLPEWVKTTFRGMAHGPDYQAPPDQQEEPPATFDERFSFPSPAAPGPAAPAPAPAAPRGMLQRGLDVLGNAAGNAAAPAPSPPGPAATGAPPAAPAPSAAPSAPPPAMSAAPGAPSVTPGPAAGPPAPTRAIQPPAATFNERFGAAPAANDSVAAQALKGAALGRAMSMSANVVAAPGGQAIVMRAATPEAKDQPFAGRVAGLPFGGLGGFSTGREAGGPAPGATGTAGDDPMTSRLRTWLGADSEGNPLTTGFRGGGDFPDASRILTDQPASFADRFGGTMSTEDGAAFGAAAAARLREGLRGTTINMNPAATSQGVAPYSAPKPTGGDTASES
jgi:hypothetical protein